VRGQATQHPCTACTRRRPCTARTTLRQPAPARATPADSGSQVLIAAPGQTLSQREASPTAPRCAACFMLRWHAFMLSLPGISAVQPGRECRKRMRHGC
jgi:hypothetical protein